MTKLTSELVYQEEPCVTWQCIQKGGGGGGGGGGQSVTGMWQFIWSGAVCVMSPQVTLNPLPPTYCLWDYCRLDVGTHGRSFRLTCPMFTQSTPVVSF